MKSILLLGVILSINTYAAETKQTATATIPEPTKKIRKTTVRLSSTRTSESGQISRTDKELNEIGMTNSLTVDHDVKPYLQISGGIGVRKSDHETGYYTVEKEGVTDASLTVRGTVLLKENLSLFFGLSGKAGTEDRKVSMKFNPAKPSQPTPTSVNAVTGGSSIGLLSGLVFQDGTSNYVFRVFKSLWVENPETETSVYGAPVNVPKGKVVEEGEDVTDLNLAYIKLLIPFKLAAGIGYRHIEDIYRLKPARSLYANSMNFINLDFTPSLYTSERLEWVLPIKYSRLLEERSVYKGFPVDDGNIFSIGVGVNFKM